MLKDKVTSSCGLLHMGPVILEFSIPVTTGIYIFHAH